MKKSEESRVKELFFKYLIDIIYNRVSSSIGSIKGEVEAENEGRIFC